MPCPTCHNKNGGIPLFKCDRCGHVRCNSTACSKIVGSSTYGDGAHCHMCGKGKLRRI